MYAMHRCPYLASTTQGVLKQPEIAILVQRCLAQRQDTFITCNVGVLWPHMYFELSIRTMPSFYAGYRRYLEKCQKQETQAFVQV